MEKRFISLFEKLTGKEDKLLKSVIMELEKAQGMKKPEGEVARGVEFEIEKKEPEEMGEITIPLEEARQEVERTTKLIEELPKVEEWIELPPEVPPQELKAEQVALEEERKEVALEEERVEEKLEKIYEKSEELLSEEKAHRKITEKVEGKKKIVEGAEDFKRKIVISIDVDEGGGEAEEHSQVSLKYTDQNGKINSMGKEELPIKGGSSIVIQEIINRIRSDIIAKSEIEAKKRIDEAEKRAKEIIDNAYKESERIINEAVSRSLDISREIENEAEGKGYKAGYEKGYKDGLEKGHEEGYKKVLSEGRYALELIRKVADEVSYAKEKFSDDFPKIVLHLTLVALKAILMADFIKDEELIVRVVKDALEKVKDFKIVKIKLNKSDVELVKRYFDLPPQIEIVASADVERGDVKIEMKEGYFESSIKWREKVIEDVLKGELLNLSKESGKTSGKTSDEVSKTIDESESSESRNEKVKSESEQA